VTRVNTRAPSCSRCDPCAGRTLSPVDVFVSNCHPAHLSAAAAKSRVCGRRSYTRNSGVDTDRPPSHLSYTDGRCPGSGWANSRSSRSVCAARAVRRGTVPGRQWHARRGCTSSATPTSTSSRHRHQPSPAARESASAGPGRGGNVFSYQRFYSTRAGVIRTTLPVGTDNVTFSRRAALTWRRPCLVLISSRDNIARACCVPSYTRICEVRHTSDGHLR